MTVDLDTVFTKLLASDERLRLLNLIELMGFDSVRVEYSGGGDSGSVDFIEFLPNRNKSSDFIRDYFEETLSQPIWDTHGSFADGGGYSVNGSVVWDAKEKTVDIMGTHHYYECDEDGEETDSNDEDWAESIYSAEDDDEVRDDSYDCLFAYAKYVLKDKFPGEYHNRMIAAAIQGDEHAKKYVKWVEDGMK